MASTIAANSKDTLGAEGRRFKSCHPDNSSKSVVKQNDPMIRNIGSNQNPPTVPEFITLQEAEKRYGEPRAKIRRWLETGQIPGERVKKGTRDVWLVSTLAFEKEEPKTEINYQAMVDRWKDEQASGYHTGRHVGPRGVQANEYGLEKYWEYLGRPKTIEGITVEGLRRALSNVPIDEEEMNCHFSLRDQMYKGVRSFYKLLIREGLRTKTELALMTEFKPTALYDPKKTVLTEPQLSLFIEKNKMWREGRSSYDRRLTESLLLIIAFSGLRRAEVLKLELKHVNMKDKIISVIDGKGHKNREVGICQELEDAINDWLKVRKDTGETAFFTQANGTPLTETVISHRVKAISDHVGIDLTTHGLRRTFATLMENRGMPWDLIRQSLGHTDIKTTQGYVLSAKNAAVDWLRAHGRQNVDKTPTEKRQIDDKPKQPEPLADDSAELMQDIKQLTAFIK